jgi:hypothetical protein
MAAKYPDDFNEVVDKAWTQVQAKRPDSEIIAAARGQISQLTLKLLPIASDTTLADFTSLMAAEALALKDRSPEACVELIFPTGKPNNFASLVPKDLALRERNLMIEMIRSSDPQNASSLPAQDLRLFMQQVVHQMPEDQVKFLGSAPLRSASPAEACEAVVTYLNALNASSSGGQVRYLRAIYSRN